MRPPRGNVSTIWGYGTSKESKGNPALKLGANVPFDQTVVDPIALRDFVQAVEGLGFDYISMADHILTVDMSLRGTRASTGEKNAFRDPMVTLGYIAACTTGVELATGGPGADAAADGSGGETGGGSRCAQWWPPAARDRRRVEPG